MSVSPVTVSHARMITVREPVWLLLQQYSQVDW